MLCRDTDAWDTLQYVNWVNVLIQYCFDVLAFLIKRPTNSLVTHPLFERSNYMQGMQVWYVLSLNIPRTQAIFVVLLT